MAPLGTAHWPLAWAPTRGLLVCPGLPHSVVVVAGLQELRVLQVIRKPICHLRAASEVTQLHVCRLHGQTRTNVPKGKEETWLQRWAGSGRVLR